MTTSVDRPHRDALQQGIDIYRDVVRDFIIRNLKRVPGSTVNQLLLDSAARNSEVYNRLKHDLDNGVEPKSAIDVGHFPHIVGLYWREVFDNATRSSTSIRNRMHLIAEGRNSVAHPGARDIGYGYAIGRLDDIETVMSEINARDAVSRIKDIVATISVPPPPRSFTNIVTPEDSSQSTTSSKPSIPATSAKGLRPWREVMRPHSDVRNGVITNDTFAANLQSVADAESAYDEYTNPIQFFNRSFITPGLKSLLVNTLRRINGHGGDPVVQMKTGFGGGKTHSLIAIYHLVESSDSISSLATNPTDATGESLKQVFDDAGVDPTKSATAKVTVLSGTERSATESTKSKNGDYRLNTLWGYMADELAGATGFEYVREASENWTAPGGSELGELFDHVGPCVILIDELVAYARNLPESRSGSFFTFLQNLTETAANRDNVALVITVPEATEELGGQQGEEALAKIQINLDAIEHVLRRMESISAPLETHEAFEVVRRRLFESEPRDPEALEKTCTAFFNMYKNAKKEYPDHASSGPYHQRLRASYPIHPEVFDRLFEDWSAIHRFQRTRGVLRLMAIAIQLLMNDSNDPMIMPGCLPLSDDSFSHEFTGIISGNWAPAVEEIDGPNSRADAVDKATPRFGRYSGGAGKRVARTIFLGSAPAAHTGKTVTGITEQQIRLGTVQPNEGVSIYNEARNSLAKQLYYLHSRESRYYLHTNPNLQKVHQDVVRQITPTKVDQRIRLIIQEMVGRRMDDDVTPIIFPADTSEIPDDEHVKLVIVHPDFHLRSHKDELDTAIDFALNAMYSCGDSKRLRRNTLLFLTGKRDNIRGLRREAAAFLGWDALARDRSEHNLNSEQEQEAKQRRVASDNLVEEALLTTYREVIAPQQPDPQRSDYEIKPFSADRKHGGHIAANAVEELKIREELLTKIGSRAFQELVNKYFIKEGVDHCSIGDMWQRLTEQVYMDRFAHRGIFEDAVQGLVDDGQYRLASGQDLNGIYTPDAAGFHVGDRARLLVRKSAFDASMELQAEIKGRQQPQKPKESDPDPPITPEHPSTGGSTKTTEVIQPRLIRQVVATKIMDGQAAIDGDYNLFRDQVVQALQVIGAEVKVRVIVEGTNEEGFQDIQLNAVRENGERHGFEITPPR